MSELTCISADSHVVEPSNLWIDYIESAYRDRAPRVVQEDDRDIFLDWEQALDDEGRLRHCLVCGKGVYRRKAFPQVTGFVVVLAFALALVGILGFAEDIPLLIGMSVVLLIDIGIL